jgi:hypothetical protein
MEAICVLSWMRQSRQGEWNSLVGGPLASAELELFLYHEKWKPFRSAYIHLSVSGARASESVNRHSSTLILDKS